MPGGVLVVVEWARERFDLLEAGTAVDGSAATATMLRANRSQGSSHSVKSILLAPHLAHW
jgi:hypothetical protein